MDKQQILDLIAAKIAGQGNQVDIGGVSNDQLDSLNVGDKVVKVTGTDKHLYLVTYKATTGGGLCLSYADAVNTETVSYDRTESGWAFNSIDKGTIPPAE